MSKQLNKGQREALVSLGKELKIQGYSVDRGDKGDEIVLSLYRGQHTNQIAKTFKAAFPGFPVFIRRAVNSKLSREIKPPENSGTRAIIGKVGNTTEIMVPKGMTITLRTPNGHQKIQTGELTFITIRR